MKNNLFQKQILEELNARLPHKSQLVNRLSSLLTIEREAVYRRLRGEVPFTFQEIVTMAREFSFSIDGIVDNTTENVSSFRLKHVEFTDPEDEDFALMEKLIHFLNFINNPSSECGEATNSIPQDLYINYDSVTRLYLFKWLYLYNDSPKVTRYKDLILNKKIIEYHTVTVAATKKIGQTRYILDMDLFRYLIKDLIYFRNIGLIDREEVRIIQEDLLKLLGDMEELCLTGVYKETGNKVQFYISNINLNASYKYIQTTTYFISFIKAFTMNAVVSFDKKSMLSVKSWLQSLIKSSTLITESGEIDRIHFFPYPAGTGRSDSNRLTAIPEMDLFHRKIWSMVTKIAFFGAKEYDITSFGRINEGFHFDIRYFKGNLNKNNVILTQGMEAVCIFVNDIADAEVIDALVAHGVQLIALRCAGFNNVDLEAARDRIKVVRVPAYSPYAVAEYTLALMLCLNRKIHRAYWRTRDGNFSLHGLMGFDMYGKTVGIIGTGKIAKILIHILKGFGMHILVHDIYPDEQFAQEEQIYYTTLNELYTRSDIISLHCPLTEDTRYLINEDSIAKMKDGVMLINTGRGQLIHTNALIEGLKEKKIAAAGLDVYEEEGEYFYEDQSDKIIDDDVLARLISFNNVIVTSHQAFFTQEAMHNIAETTLQNVADFRDGKVLVNEVTV